MLQHEQAASLLRWRRSHHRWSDRPTLSWASFGTRDATPFVKVAGSSIASSARELNAELIEDRGMDVEADILAIIQTLFEIPDKRQISMKDIATELQKRYGGEYDRNITSKWVGGIVRRRLQIRTQKSNGVYIIPITQRPKLERLFEKYGLQGGLAGEGKAA